jgi:hypothetical protein
MMTAVAAVKTAAATMPIAATVPATATAVPATAATTVATGISASSQEHRQAERGRRDKSEKGRLAEH